MMDYVDAALMVLFLGQFIFFVWLAHTAGRIDGLTGEIRRKPGIVRKLRDLTDKPSELHLPTDFEKLAKDEVNER